MLIQLAYTAPSARLRMSLRRVPALAPRTPALQAHDCFTVSACCLDATAFAALC
jgi:hypothetical protein